MIDAILSRLDRVRPNGSDRWTACCPAHDDRSPSLTIKNAGDRILLHCFGGCTTREVCAALGIELYQLFRDGKAPRQVVPGVSQRVLAEAVSLERLVLAIASDTLNAGRELSPTDKERARLARQRLELAEAHHAGG